MQPIATYTEVRFEGSRIFTLFPDRMVIRGKQSLASEFEVNVALNLLDPIPDILRCRSRVFQAGMWLVLAGFIGCSVLVGGFQIDWATLPFGLLFGIGMSGVMFMLATARKVAFIRFKNDGGMVVLDIARAGKNAAQLDAFIETLVKQIREARQATAGKLQALDDSMGTSG